MGLLEDARMVALKAAVVCLMSFPLVRKGEVDRAGAHRCAEWANCWKGSYIDLVRRNGRLVSLADQA